MNTPKSKAVIQYNRNYPSVADLKKGAERRIPKFAFEYLVGGCNHDENLQANHDDLKSILLEPQYLTKYQEPNMQTELFGHVYDAPFGIAPVGLQGMIWPNAPEILAKASLKHNVPYILSTVSTSSIERISELSEGRAWFQLYHPTEDSLRDDLIQRASDAQCPVFVVIVDVPSFGHRPRDIRNGLSMPPKMSIRNILQVMTKPVWALETLIAGTPQFATLKKYMDSSLNLKQLGEFMNQTFTGRMDKDKVAAIRDRWKGALVLKGIVSEEDTQHAIDLGVDGIIVSNHGGRQLDIGESSIKPMQRLAKTFQGKIKVMLDSGLTDGADAARALAVGAEFTFMGRTFLYGVGALGRQGGEHTLSLLKTELQQIMEQIGCQRIKDFPKFYIPSSK